jgi:hypothetical protein
MKTKKEIRLSEAFDLCDRFGLKKMIGTSEVTSIEKVREFLSELPKIGRILREYIKNYEAMPFHGNDVVKYQNKTYLVQYVHYNNKGIIVDLKVVDSEGKLSELSDLNNIKKVG